MVPLNRGNFWHKNQLNRLVIRLRLVLWPLRWLLEVLVCVHRFLELIKDVLDSVLFLPLGEQREGLRDQLRAVRTSLEKHLPFRCSGSQMGDWSWTGTRHLGRCLGTEARSWRWGCKIRRRTLSNHVRNHHPRSRHLLPLDRWSMHSNQWDFCP